MVTVHNFSYGLVNPALGYLMSCLGAFLGLRCVTRARAYTGSARIRWVILAAIALGAAGIWSMHFIAMLGYAIPGQTILYNVPLTIASMLIAIVVVGIGLFIVGFSSGGWRPLLIGGAIVGVGVATMHYLGMAAMIMPDSVHYNVPLFVLSVIIALVAGTAALWFGTQVRGIGATIGASLIFGVAVSGMHYTGMAAMHVTMGSMAAMSGSDATSFLVPLLVGISFLTFAMTLVISLSPSEAEIQEDAALQHRIDTQFPEMRMAAQAQGQRPAPSAPSAPSAPPAPYNGYAPQAPAAPPASSGLFTPRGQSAQQPVQPSQSPQPLPVRRAGESRNGRNWPPRDRVGRQEYQD
jgi:NO-binding membrane sensor protein with MHYT domain